MLNASLNAYQACFVVEDVERAIEMCVSTLGWGPFQHFKIPSPNAKYRNWQGQKVTEVALGMGGRAQVELIRVHEGEDAIEQYQSRMGCGLQHLGVLCQNTDEALALLTPLGGLMNDRNQYGEITFTFVDIPTGPAMFELLERGEQGLPTEEEHSKGEKIGLTRESSNERLRLDRASLVTKDISHSAHFFAKAFDGQAVNIESDCLRFENASGDVKEVSAQRCLIHGGVLSLELIEVNAEGTDPYALQLQRARQHQGHGLIHIGGKSSRFDTTDAGLAGTWLNRQESFKLCVGPDDRLSLQLRADAD